MVKKLHIKILNNPVNSSLKKHELVIKTMNKTLESRVKNEEIIMILLNLIMVFVEFKI